MYDYFALQILLLGILINLLIGLYYKSWINIKFSLLSTVFTMLFIYFGNKYDNGLMSRNSFVSSYLLMFIGLCFVMYYVYKNDIKRYSNVGIVRIK
jgi:hypothetical protein